MSEPVTPTGHQLVARKRRSMRDPEHWGEAGYQEGEIVAIEAEAAALEHERLSRLHFEDGSHVVRGDGFICRTCLLLTSVTLVDEPTEPEGAER